VPLSVITSYLTISVLRKQARSQVGFGGHYTILYASSLLTCTTVQADSTIFFDDFLTPMIAQITLDLVIALLAENKIALQAIA
jgi:hypothetical protein